MKKWTAAIALVLVAVIVALGIFLSDSRADDHSDIKPITGQPAPQATEQAPVPSEPSGSEPTTGQNAPQASEQAAVPSKPSGSKPTTGQDTPQASEQAAVPSEPSGSNPAAGQNAPQLSEQAKDPSDNAAGSTRKEMVTVTFIGPDERILLVTEVESGTAALPPENPNMPQGYIFSHWDKAFSCVTEDLLVSAVCQEVGGQENVIALSGGYVHTGEEVRIPVQLCGNVLLCAFDIRIRYDQAMLEFVEFRNKDGAVDANCNAQTGEIYFNYASIENTAGEVYLAELVFRAAGEPGETNVDVDVMELIAYDSDYHFYEPVYHKLSGTVTVVEP